MQSDLEFHHNVDPKPTLQQTFRHIAVHILKPSLAKTEIKMSFGNLSGNHTKPFKWVLH